MENKNLLNDENLKNVSGGAVLKDASSALDREIESLFETGKNVLYTREHNTLDPVGDKPENMWLDIKRAVMTGDMEKAKDACNSFREYMVSIDWGGLLNTKPFKNILDMYG